MKNDLDNTPAAKLTLYSEMAQFKSAVDALYGRLGLTLGNTDLQKRALNTLLCQLVAYPKLQRIGLRSGNFTDNPLGIGYPQVLKLIEAHAMLHQASREAEQSAVLAHRDDYVVVRELMAEFLKMSLASAVSPRVRDVVEAVKQLNKREVSQVDIAEVMGVHRSTALRDVKDAIEAGYLRNLELRQRSGKYAKIVLGDALPEDVEILPSVNEVFKDS